MAYKIDEVEGIGSGYAKKLAKSGVGNTSHLLAQGATAAGRRKLSASSGISTALLLKWANHADLMRITGIGPQFSELLEAAGVDTVKELRTRNADNLAAKMTEVRKKKKLTRLAPSATVIQRWIDAAKGLSPLIKH